MSTAEERKFAFLGSKDPKINNKILDFFMQLRITNKARLLCRNPEMYYFINQKNDLDCTKVLPKGYIFQLETYLTVMKNQEEKIPEYVECIKPLLRSTVGKIYKVIDSKNCESGLLEYNYSWKEDQFKPSTKEAYEAQNTYLKAAEYTPQVGDYVVMEKAGGCWGYSADNNGCVAIVNRVGKNRVDREEVFTIWGEVINPNNSRSVKFSNIPQFGYDKEVIFRKALPQIPGSNVKAEPQQQVAKWSKGTYAVAIKGNFGNYKGSDNIITVGSIFTITADRGDRVVEVIESIFWVYKENLKWFATYGEAKEFSEKMKQNPSFPGKPSSVKAIEKQIKKNKFQSVHEIKIVEEKLLKKTKSKLFNI